METLKFDKLSFSTLFEKTLVRVTAEFNSEVTPTSVSSGLSKKLKRKVSKETANSFNVNIKRESDGIYKIESAFMMYRDARLFCINLFSWIENNGSTDKRCNFYVDIKFMDQTEGPFKGTLFNTGVTIEKIDKLKMILDFNEDRVYKVFPSRRYGFNSTSINSFTPNQRFIPKQDSPVDPKFYTIPETTNSGINFETLNHGFLRLQYIGGENYEKKAVDILEITSEFVVSAWNCTYNPGYSKENITKFEKVVDKQSKIRESFYDYKLFKKNFPNIKFTVDLLENPITLDQFYQAIRDRIFELLINMEIKGEIELNYDSNISILQLKSGSLKCKSIKNVEFIDCKIENGNFVLCDFYHSEINNSILNKCNLTETEGKNSILIDSVVNRSSEILDCEFKGSNGVMNGKMEKGLFMNGGIGPLAEVSSSVTVIEYTKVKPGYWVVGDKVIIPTKKYKPL